MGLGSPGFLLAWGPTRAAVLAADIGTLIQNPAVLLGAAAVVVVAVLIVLIMVLRGGSKRAELAPELDEEREAWDAAPRGAANQASKGYDSRDQMLPWEQGGAHADGGRPPMGGKRGPGGRDAQAGWGQADQDAQWEHQGQPSPRGGQWVGTDEWAPSAPAMGRGGADQRAQGQMGPRDNEGWGWGAGQASPGGQNGDQWGQGAASAPGQGVDQWGQGPGASHPQGRGVDQWGQGAASAPSRGIDQWSQGPGASHPQSRGADQWGQGAPLRGGGQDQWSGQAAPFGQGVGQAEDQGFGLRSDPRRGAEPASPADGQWGQGDWGQANGGWSSGEPANQWGQPAASVPPQPSARPGQPGNSRPSGQGGMGGMGGQPQPVQNAGSEWGAPGFAGSAPASPPPSGGWSDREPPAWQVDPRREQPSWEAQDWKSAEPERPGPRISQPNQASSRPQWEQAGQGTAEPSWSNAGSVGEWGQPEPAPRPTPGRPIESAGAGRMPPPSPSDREWEQRGFDGPTVKPTPQPNSWEQREAPAWQSPAPQMAAPAGQVETPTVRSGMGQLGKVSPESTAYAPQAAESSEAVDKTVVIRKDAGTARIPAVVVRQGKEPGRTYDMRKDHISIGRSRESDIFLEDLAVSRLHATIYRDEMGGYLLRDENSANGTSVNGQRVTECALQEGDEIQLGQTILAFVRR